jgi:SHS2 domain-containing protein
MGSYAFLEDIALADCAIEVDGRDLDDLFETVARAVAEIMVDPATVASTVRRAIALSADALDLLLFDWIAELLYLKDSEQLVFPRVDVNVTEGHPCRLTAQATGGVIDRERTSLRADPKAPTFHQFALDPHGAGWRARVVIDI